MWLGTVDAGLFWTGLGLMLGAVVVWYRRGRRDLLADSPARPNRLTPEIVMSLAAGYVVASLVVASVIEWLGGEGAYRLSAGAGVQAAGGLACLWLGARYFEGGMRRFVLGNGRVLLRIGQGAVLVVAAMAMCYSIFESTKGVMHWLMPDYQPPEHSVLEALQKGTEPVWVLRLGAAVIAPVAEECFFRGIFQTVVRNLYGRAWPAVIFSAVLFGLAHADQPQVVPTLIALGVVLGAFYERSGSLTGPIALHVLFNLKTLAWQALGAGP
ncbi:MAG: lysostaphin resistance A-like protein [Phycisphaerae bacterium]